MARTRPESSMRQARRYLARLERVRRRIAVIATVRLVAFVAFGAFGFAAWHDDAWAVYGPIAAAGLVAFVAAAVLHRAPHALAPRLEALARVYERRAARCAGDWSALPEDGARFLDPAFPHLGELQVFGRGSLFQLLDRAALPGARVLLARRLRDGLTEAELPPAQAAAQELARASGFRARLEAEGRLVELDPAQLDRFLRWAGDTEATRFASRWVWPARALVAFAWACIIGAAGLELETPWKLALGLNVLVFLATTGRLAPTYADLVGQSQARPFVAMRRMFERVEGRRFHAPRLLELRASLCAAGPPSRRLVRLESLTDSLSVRANPLSFFIANALGLWELQVVAALEAWRQRHGPRVGADLEHLAELEVYSSIAGFAADHPQFVWPTVDTHAERALEGEGLGHPLIPESRRKVNDFTHPGPGHLVLITGSNMAGKSSFLRTLGVNTILAQAGAPVCARRFVLRPAQLSTSIQVTDSPDQGLSRFYAEVKRIRRILDECRAAADDPRAPMRLFLVDEMLSGTNSRERHVASVSVARHLLDQVRAFGLVTTHDLGLVALERDFPDRVETWHFTDRFDGQALHFDYTLRPGVATTTNALDVLRLEGIEVFEG